MVSLDDRPSRRSLLQFGGGALLGGVAGFHLADGPSGSESDPPLVARLEVGGAESRPTTMLVQLRRDGDLVWWTVEELPPASEMDRYRGIEEFPVEPGATKLAVGLQDQPDRYWREFDFSSQHGECFFLTVTAEPPAVSLLSQAAPEACLAPEQERR